MKKNADGSMTTIIKQNDELEGDALNAAVSNIFATRSEHKVLETVFGIKRDAVNDKESANVDLF